MTKRKIAEHSIAASKEMLLLFGAKHSVGKALDTRQKILFATIMRAVNSADAITLLYRDKPYVEEMGSLLRVLVEMVINSCYLQVAPTSEVESYRTYDSIMMSKMVRLATEFIPESADIIPIATQEAFAEHVKAVKEVSETTVSNTSWTKLNLGARAVAVDTKLGVKIFQFLSRFIYPQGHAYTHTTHRSLESTIETLETGVLPIDEIRGEADLMLYGVSQTLHALGLAVSLLYEDASFDSHLRVIEIVQLSYDAAPSK